LILIRAFTLPGPGLAFSPPFKRYRAAHTRCEEVKSKMAQIRVKDGESIESALKRFKKATEKAGILSEIRKREHYEKPSVKKKKKALAAKKRAVKKLRKNF
jgi:small subunit ribosomal protein S21